MDVERIVRTHVAASDAAAAPAELVAGEAWRLLLCDRPDPKRDMTGIEVGQIGLLEVVRASGEYITAVEDSVRVKG